MESMTRRAGGFSLVELLIAMAVMVTFAGALLSLVLAGEIDRAHAARSRRRAAARAHRPADARRRARARRRGPGSRAHRPVRCRGHFAPIGPSARRRHHDLVRLEPRGADDAGGAAAAGRDRRGHPERSACPPSDPGCAFAPASTAIVFDDRGCRDVLRIDAVTATSLQVRAGSRACGYQPGAAVAQGEVRTYRVDPATRQLLRRDEATGLSVPVLDIGRRTGRRVPRWRTSRAPDAPGRGRDSQPAGSGFRALVRRQAAESSEAMTWRC